MNEVIKAEWARYKLDFRFDARTSRGSMTSKKTYLLRLTDSDGRRGVGEIPLFEGLSHEDTPEFENILDRACVELIVPEVSSIKFGFESAKSALSHPGRAVEPIKINGLIWMGDKDTMLRRIDEKLDAGFHVLKMKIGGIDFEDECRLLSYIRERYSEKDLELRLDANGSFTTDNAMSRLERLAEYSVHSIEQPIAAGQAEAMAAICKTSPISIALDEELIGKWHKDVIMQTLDVIRPQYVILKPALCGGFGGAEAWANAASERGIGWWVTSALESNVGLMAISRWLSDLNIPGSLGINGLGTGQLFSNNFEAPISMHGDSIIVGEGYAKVPESVWNQNL